MKRKIRLIQKIFFLMILLVVSFVMTIVNKTKGVGGIGINKASADYTVASSSCDGHSCDSSEGTEGTDGAAAEGGPT